MAAKIAIGDTIRIYDPKRGEFERQYGRDLPTTWVVKAQDFVGKKRRLHVEGPPGAIWAMHARIVKRAAQ